jgi:hypothetical protein
MAVSELLSSSVNLSISTVRAEVIHKAKQYHAQVPFLYSMYLGVTLPLEQLAL